MKKFLILYLSLFLISSVSYGKIDEIEPPSSFEEVEPEETAEEVSEEPSSDKTADEETLSETTEQAENSEHQEEEVKEHETTVEYSQEQEYKYMHEMRKIYEEEYRKDYKNVDNVLKLAKIYLDLGQRSTAKAYYMQLYNMYPNDPKIQFEMGKFYYQCKQYNAAIEFFKLSLSSGYLKNIEVNEYTRKTYAKLGDEENEKLYEQILEHLRS